MENLINREEAKKVAKELASKWNQDEETIYSFIIFLNGRQATNELMGQWLTLRRYQLEWLRDNSHVVKQLL